MVRREGHDAEIHHLLNRVSWGGNNARRHERYVSAIVDDDFDKISNENYDNVSLSHKDQFG
jgi:hypothetical protein